MEYTVALVPGLAGALLSPLFVSKNTWGTRAGGFLAGEVLVVLPAYLFVCSLSGANGRSLASCGASLLTAPFDMMKPTQKESV